MRRLLIMWMLALTAAAVIPLLLAGAGESRAEAAFGTGEVSAAPGAARDGNASGEPNGTASSEPEASPPPGAVELEAADAGRTSARETFGAESAVSAAPKADEPSRGEEAFAETEVGSSAGKPEPDAGEVQPRVPDAETVVRVQDGNSTRLMPLAGYLEGVVAAEMPPSFPEAALEAQAVAARSLVYYRMAHPKHSGADVCTDPGCCMAFGEATDESRAAVAATDGSILVYGGEAAMAAFFSSSDGRTRSAEEVWGAAVPYLSGVASGENMAQNGHGVGMSQYGAREMALGGADWREILEWYYPGAEVT